MTEDKAKFHLVWGVVLLLAGIGVFFRIPQVMPRIRSIEYFAAIIGFVQFSFYLLGVLLVSGGARKIYLSWRSLYGRRPGA